jgi:hypothetical protein
MKEILLKYLLQFQQLGLPGIGYLQLYIRASQTDIVGKRILPPTPSFRLTGEIPPGTERDLVRFVSGRMQVVEDVAERQIQDFCSASLEGIKKGVPLEWKGFGSIRKGIAGEMTFELASKSSIFAFPPVPAERVIRTNAEHTILVGDTEKTNTQMSELLLEEGPHKRSTWWIWALVLVVVASSVLAFYLYQHNGRMDGFRNQEPLPANAP